MTKTSRRYRESALGRVARRTRTYTVKSKLVVFHVRDAGRVGEGRAGGDLKEYMTMRFFIHDDQAGVLFGGHWSTRREAKKHADHLAWLAAKVDELYVGGFCDD